MNFVTPRVIGTEPKHDFPDEVIFIIYHQITELYFKLSLHI